VCICASPRAIKRTTRRKRRRTRIKNRRTIITTKATSSQSSEISTTAGSSVGGRTTDLERGVTGQTTTAVGHSVGEVVTTTVTTVRTSVVKNGGSTVGTETTTVVNIGEGLRTNVDSGVEHRTTVVARGTRVGTIGTTTVGTQSSTGTITTGTEAHTTDVTTTTAIARVRVNVLTDRSCTKVTTVLFDEVTGVTTDTTIVIISEISNTIRTVIIGRLVGGSTGTTNGGVTKSGTVDIRTTTTSQFIVPSNTDTVTAV